MRQITSLIFLLICLGSSLIPCCPTDGCEDEIVAVSSHSEGDKEESEGGCSPFFACPGCPAPAELLNTTLPINIVSNVDIDFPWQTQEQIDGFNSSLFQPPRRA